MRESLDNINRYLIAYEQVKEQGGYFAKARASANLLLQLVPEYKNVTSAHTQEEIRALQQNTPVPEFVNIVESILELSVRVYGSPIPEQYLAGLMQVLTAVYSSVEIRVDKASEYSGNEEAWNSLLHKLKINESIVPIITIHSRFE